MHSDPWYSGCSTHINVGSLGALPDFTFRKVVLKGRWDTSHVMLLGPRVRDGTNGYHVVVPFIRSDGSTVLVDRGFVTKELAQNARRLLTNEQGEVEILGMLRTSQVRNYFTPDNHPEKGEWYWADIDAMASYAGGLEAGIQPVFVEEVFGTHHHIACTRQPNIFPEGHGGEASSRLARGYPIGRSPTVDVRNSHVSYIVTW